MFQNYFTAHLTEKASGLQVWAIATMNRGFSAPPDFWLMNFHPPVDLSPAHTVTNSSVTAEQEQLLCAVLHFWNDSAHQFSSPACNPTTIFIEWDPELKKKILSSKTVWDKLEDKLAQ